MPWGRVRRRCDYSAVILLWARGPVNPTTPQSSHMLWRAGGPHHNMLWFRVREAREDRGGGGGLTCVDGGPPQGLWTACGYGELSGGRGSAARSGPALRRLPLLQEQPQLPL